MVLDKLPSVAANAKLFDAKLFNRAALPSPFAKDDAEQELEYEAPDGEVEKQLADIWQHVLQVERVNRQDNFFELGGYSLLAASCHSY